MYPTQCDTCCFVVQTRRHQLLMMQEPCVCRVTTSLLYRVSHACSVQFTKVAVLRLKGANTTGIHARESSHTVE